MSAAKTKLPLTKEKPLDRSGLIEQVDELNKVVVGLRGAEIALEEAIEQGIQSNDLSYFLTDSIDHYARRVDAVSKRLYDSVPHVASVDAGEGAE
jgi:hypothetical protein